MELVTEKIFPQPMPTSDPVFRRSPGFTLLEVLIVLGIIVTIIAVGAPKLFNKKADLRKTIRRLAVLSRDLKSRAKLNSATYRLVIHMDVTGDKRVDSYWVEKAKGQVLTDYDPDNPPELPDPEKKKDEDAPVEPFTPDTQSMKKPEVLPNGLEFESIELGSTEDPISEGLAYIHYFPSGFADDAAIHIRWGDKLKWTLALEPITGRIEVLEEFVALKDLRGSK